MLPTVAVALSGGVDSAVAAALLQEQGQRVAGITMSIPVPGNERALADAGAVCRVLGIPHHVIDLSSLFLHEVVEPFVRCYLAGLTPNPCVRCNARVKFGALRAAARDLGAELFATGHYARTEPAPPGAIRLLRGADPGKDQAYFLWALSQAELRGVLFPLGGMGKVGVRALAAARGLPVHDKEESFEVCFVPGDDLRAFLRRMAPGRILPGPVEDTAGRVLGTHQGVAFYTVGQRKGLGVAGGEPLYVTRLVPERGAVVLGTREEASSRSFTAGGASWIAGAPPAAGFEAGVQVRHRQRPLPGRVTMTGDGFGVVFREPQPGIAPGQSAVLFRGDEVLGGGVINQSLPGNSNL